jgi:hypothetical protein
MNAMKIAAILLIVAGALALAYGGFTYTDTHRASVGSLQLTVKEKDFFSIPIWAGVGSIVVGGLLLVGVGRKS